MGALTGTARLVPYVGLLLASTAIPALMEWCQMQTLNVEMLEQKLPPFDDVFVHLIEQEAADV